MIHSPSSQISVDPERPSEVARRLRCVLLTTDTKHHRYFANRMAQRADLTVILEPERPHHPKPPQRFLDMQEDFEDHFFGEAIPSSFSGHQVLCEVEPVNGPACIGRISDLKPDLLIAFGTGRLLPQLFGQGRLSLNVHRGILPNYRGLDSDLWAFYFGDFENVGTTLHQMESRLDTGPILWQKRLKIQRGCEPHQLRYSTTLLAAEGMGEICDRLERGVPLRATPQDLSKGRYFSIIPPLKRRIALWRFSRYVRRLR